jgi:predicted permease
MMDTLIQDVRFGLRMLFKNPGFTIVAVLTLALAIGANTAIFSVLNALILKTLPVKQSGELVTLGNPARVHSRSGGTPNVDIFSYPLFKELRDGNQVFTGMYATGDARRLRIKTDNSSNAGDEPVRGRLITGDYFSVLGIQAAQGRVFTPAESEPRNPTPAVVISNTYWKRKFNSNPAIIGQTIRLNDSPMTVIGVLPAGFDGDISGELLDVWIPLSMQEQIQPGKDWVESPRVSWLMLMGRLKPGVTPAQAQASINVLFQQLVNGSYGASVPNDDRESIKHVTIAVQSGARGFSWARDQFSRPMVLLLGIVGLVLLIACTNVSSMLLARSAARHKEIALRLALGAEPKRIFRQLLTESVLLAAVGGLVGILVAEWGSSLLLRWVGQQYTRLVLDTSLDSRVTLFTAAICVLTGILFGLVPAIRALRTEVSPSLEPGSRMSASTGRGLFSPGNLLVAGQFAIAVLVIFVSGLFVRSLQNLQQLDLGYSRDNLLVMRLDTLAAGYTSQRTLQLGRELTDAIATVPGVSGVAASENGLFSGTESGDDINVEGFTPGKDDDLQAAFDQVGPKYFSTVGIPILMGREITEADNAAAPKIAVVNESFARFYFKNQNPIGRRFTMKAEEYKNLPPIEIVGVSRDAHDHELREKPDRRIYLAMMQSAFPISAVNLEIRTSGDPAAVMDGVRNKVKSIDAALPVGGVDTVNTLAMRTVFAETMLARLAGMFAILALVLAAVGIYGLMSYLVVSRTKEIGIRMALGAQRGQILFSILRHTMMLATAGVAIGIPVALVGTQAIKATLFGVGSVDVLSLLAAVALLGVVALSAGFIPARTATKVDPMVALRYE